ncbi:MAG: hypothetical protein KGL39_22650 [Patescibacteria group bacterium]|nr:hypothetical protein [Patescibacteria group bacterium]
MEAPDLNPDSSITLRSTYILMVVCLILGMAGGFGLSAVATLVADR